MPLTPEEFAEKIKGIMEGEHADDCERLHGETDDAMEELLTDLGYGKAVEIIRNSERWYA